MTHTVAAVGGGRAARALRLLLLLVLALAAVEYLFGSILDASPLRTYIYQPLYNSTQVASRNTVRISSYWPKRLPINTFSQVPVANRSSAHNRNTTHSRNTTYIRNTTHSRETTNSRNFTNSPNATYTKQSSVRLSEEKQNSSQTTVSASPEVAQNSSSSHLLSNLNLTERLKILMTTEGFVEARNESDVPLCDVTPPDLGPVPVNKTDMDLDEVEKKYPEVGWGGRYVPPNCTARHKVAIIVPYRDRRQHLAVFLNHMHPFLMKQQLEYGIFIIEQEGALDFNRAKLMNVGYKESMRLKAGGWQCFVFHDIDLLPLDSRNIYSCPRQPRHMSASIDKLNFRLPYEDIFGGVSAMTNRQFTKVNGFSNKYWGWGGEDDDMFYRLKKMRYHIARYKMSIARYAMLDHKKSSPNPKRYQLLSQTNKIFQKDGLSTLQYEVVKVTQYHLHTHVLVNINERS